MQSINGWYIKHTLLLFQQFSAMCVLGMAMTIKFRYVLLPLRSCVKFCLWLDLPEGNTWVRVLGGDCVQFCQHGNRSIKEQGPKQAFKMSFPHGFDVCVFLFPLFYSSKRIWKDMSALQASPTKCTGSLWREASSSPSWLLVRTHAAVFAFVFIWTISLCSLWLASTSPPLWRVCACVCVC